MEIKIDSSSNIACPCCGGDYLHQVMVETYWRSEDSPQSVSSRSTPEMLEKDIVDRNPSPRRQGILIRFSCESCDADPELAIYQHKGQTVIEWYSVRKLVCQGGSL